MRQLDRARRRALLHLAALEAHARADERGDQLAVLVAVFLAQVVLDPPAAEVAVLDRAVEAVEDDAAP